MGSRPSHFLGWPTRGGWLTLLNCGLWALVGISIAGQTPFYELALVAIWPIAWLAVPGRGAGEQDVIVFAVVAGLNSLLWGYGLSWLISIPGRLRRRYSPEYAPPGFDVLAPHPPEADVVAEPRESS